MHAILLTEPGTDVNEIVRLANERLLDHQKIRGAAAWSGAELPRTEGTRKLKRRELKQWLAGTQQPSTSAKRVTGRASVPAVLGRFAPGRDITPSTTISELGLSSLERVELMMALEEAFQITVDEPKFAAASTVADLEELTRPLDASGATVVVPQAEPIAFPAWNRTLIPRAMRRASLPTWILPLARVFVSLKVEGLEHLSNIHTPVIFAANHQSHMDGPIILDALPPNWRYRVSPAMSKEFFKPHFYPGQYGRRAWLTNSLNYYLAASFFCAFPLPQRETGTRQALRYMGELIGDGFSILIFPEGRRTESGEIAPFQPGVGMIAARLEIPVVPVRLEGLDRILHHRWKFPVRGKARVAFGAPMLLNGNDYGALGRQIEDAVRRL